MRRGLAQLTRDASPASPLPKPKLPILLSTFCVTFSSLTFAPPELFDAPNERGVAAGGEAILGLRVDAMSCDGISTGACRPLM